VKPLPDAIEPCTAEVAKRLFLLQFKTLTQRGV